MSESCEIYIKSPVACNLIQVGVALEGHMLPAGSQNICVLLLNICCQATYICSQPLSHRLSIFKTNITQPQKPPSITRLA